MTTPEERLEQVYAAAAGIRRLEALMGVLRGPGGCPWDHDQTHQTLAKYLLEETYEVLDALDSGDVDQIEAELGDLLLQVVFHVQIARENGQFDLDSIAEREVTKMVERHPHVFAEAHAESADDVRDQWENRKRRDDPDRSIADGVPQAMPALNRAQTISARAASLGFDWNNIGEVWEKVNEELAEARDADKDELEEELGDLMFALVNVARHAGLDAEGALRNATRKFVSRFDAMEKPTKPRNSGESAASQWDSAWDRAKRLLKTKD